MMTFATWLAVGLATGGVAGSALKSGGRGRASDIALALFGSSLVSLVGAFAWEAATDVGVAGTALLAFVGAAGAIGAQRALWGDRA